MKYVIRQVEPDGYARFICPNCGNTLFISDETTEVDLPDHCGHCGRDVYFYINDLIKEDKNEND